MSIPATPFLGPSSLKPCHLRFSKQGGEKVWTDLLQEAGFPSPFEPGALKELAGKVEALLEEIRP